MKKKSLLKALLAVLVICLTIFISGCGKPDLAGEWIQVIPEGKVQTGFSEIKIEKNGDDYSVTREIVKYSQKAGPITMDPAISKKFYSTYKVYLDKHQDDGFNNDKAIQKGDQLTIPMLKTNNVYTYNSKDDTLTDNNGIVYKRDQNLITKNIQIIKQGLKDELEKQHEIREIEFDDNLKK